MITFNQYLTELFDKAVPYQSVKTIINSYGSFTKFKFTVGSHYFEVNIGYTTRDNNIEVDFYLLNPDGSTTVKTTGEAGHQVSVKVFATVADILKHALKNWPNARITFIGDGLSKVKLYRSLGMKLAKVLNYKYDERGAGDWIGVILKPK